SMSTWTKTTVQLADLGKAMAPSGQIALTPQVNLTNGTAAGQANVAWAAHLTIAAGQTTVIGLYDLTDDLGNAIVVGHLKHLLISNTSSIGGATLQLGGEFGTARPWLTMGLSSGAGGIVLGPGGAFMVTEPNAGLAVHEEPGSELILTNTDATHALTVDILIVGTNV
ncbi:MAG: hypothetical protein WCI73_15735, partial [Phycisphaerae bacterium]